MSARSRGGQAVALAALWLAAACGGAAGVEAPPGPEMGPEAVLELVMRADDARTAALSGTPGPAPDAIFTGPALAGLLAKVRTLRERGQRVELAAESRRLVHVGGSMAVLEIRARERHLSAGSPPGDWALTLRQWEVRWVRAKEGWRVSEEHDLPPTQWWPS